MPVETVGAGRHPVQQIFNDYTITPVTTSAYVQLLAAMPQNARFVYPLFDSSGQIMIIAFGAAGFEVNQFYIPPGGFPDGYPFFFPSGVRVSIKAQTSYGGAAGSGATVGALAMTLLT